jgi:hypothetical protein
MATATNTTPPAIDMNVNNGDTITFDANGMFIITAEALAAPGNTMGNISMTTSWGLDTQGNTSGAPSIKAGTFVFEDPYYVGTHQTVTATATDEQGNQFSKTVTFNVV